MKKHLLILFSLLLATTARAQFQYTLKDTVTPYAPLTGASSANGTLIWDEDIFSIAMPFTWKMDSTISMNRFNLFLPFSTVIDQFSNFGDVNGFVLCDADIADRGLLDSITTLSPIRYQTVGTTPNRIFKLEFFNAGFYTEFDQYQTMDDSFNLQIWIYETSNIVEYHFGPSRVTHASDYFAFGNSGPLVGYAKHVDFDFGSTGTVYHLTGNPSTPSLDTVFITPTAPPIWSALSSWPADGKVYRFTPGAPKCAAPVSGFSSAGTTTARTVEYTYNGSTAGLDSLVWDFGDNTAPQKITSGFNAPLAHAFASDGFYNVCVTAYHKCGNHKACKQTPLSAGSLAALGDVRVYPNPSRDRIMVEGLQEGGRAELLSLTGQSVLRAPVSSPKQSLNLSSLPAGSYLLRLTDRNGLSGTIRIVKQ